MVKIKEYKIKGKISSTGEIIAKINIPVKKIEPTTQDLIINPSLEETQIFNPDVGTYYKTVTCNPAEIIKTQLTVTATNQEQTYIPEQNNEFYNEVIVNPIVPEKFQPDFVSFYGCNVANPDLSWLDTSRMTSWTNMFANTKISDFSFLNNLDTSNVTDFKYCFSSNNQINNFVFRVNMLNTSKSTSFENTFYNCFRTIEIQCSDWDVSKSVSFMNTFSSCSALVNIDISKWDMSSTVQPQYMFRGCNSLSNNSLHSIIKALTTTPSTMASNYKSLKWVGLSSAQATTCTGFDEWQTLVSKGWITGY